MTRIHQLWWLAPSWLNTRHVGQFVCNAFVAVDAGALSGKEIALMNVCGSRILLRQVHRNRAVAVATLQGIIGLQSRPFAFRKFQASVKEFLSRADGAEQMTPDLLRCLHFAGDFVGPVMRHVAIGADCAHT